MQGVKILKAGVEQSEIPGVYGKIAPVYDAWAWLTESRARRRCLELAEVRDGESVLEVAVGTGLMFQELLRRNPRGRTAGVDLTPAMLERARRKAAATGAPFELAVGDAKKLPFEDGGFDLLVNNYMFDLLPEESFGGVLEEFRRVLKPGGRMVLVNMAPGEAWHQRLFDKVYRINPRWMGGCRGVEILPYAERAGFVDLRREYLSQFGFPSEILTARKGMER